LHFECARQKSLEKLLPGIKAGVGAHSTGIWRIIPRFVIWEPSIPGQMRQMANTFGLKPIALSCLIR
jgi:hypothetical protein